MTNHRHPVVLIFPPQKKRQVEIRDRETRVKTDRERELNMKI